MPAVRAPALMIQGTGSNVGKSLIVAGLCRLFANRGLTVAPFKPQNMSNNAAACPDGGEIGRAQALQARASRRDPTVHMNPVLLKPESDTGSQVIVQGRRWATLKARDYGRRKGELLPAVLESFAKISAGSDLVIVEGAGSPAEINLRAGDIANMGFAVAADVPVVLVGDIDRGGVIASLVGCHAVLPAPDRERIKAFAINRFRGDPTLFDEGMAQITAMTDWPGLGIIPHFADARRLPAEDTADLDQPRRNGSKATAARIRIAVPRAPRIANFDDLDPLKLEPSVDLVLVEPGSALPGDCDLVILPGSKSTVSDLRALCDNGWDIDIKAHVRRGGHVLGLCGGYQMLGRTIADPAGVEGPAGTVDGLGLLDIETTLTGNKTVRPVEAVAAGISAGVPVTGYEIHLGRTSGPDCARPLLHVAGTPDGATSPDGRVSGTYIHGLFVSDAFRAAFLSALDPGHRGTLGYDAEIEATLDRLAGHLANHLDIDQVLAIARSR